MGSDDATPPAADDQSPDGTPYDLDFPDGQTPDGMHPEGVTPDGTPSDGTPIGDPLVVPPEASDVPPEASEVQPEVAEASRATSGFARPSAGAIILAIVVVAATVTAGLLLSRPDEPPVERTSLPLDAWLPYWTLDETTESRIDEVDTMRDVSPFWYSAEGVDEIVIDPNADPDTTDRFLDLLRESGADVVPSIVDALPAGQMAAILDDPETRTQHVDAIVAFAEDGDFDGIDLDYERFAFFDGRDTWESTRPNWVAFVEELGAELHADGRTLTVSIPPIYDGDRSSSSGYWVYDHGAIAPHVDRIRIMAYDYSVGEPGPIAPLSFVQRSVDGALDVGVDREKLVLGIPIYGRNWPIGVSGTCPAGTELEDVTSVNLRTIDDLIARRSAVPVFDDVTGESSFEYDIEFSDDSTSCTQSRSVHYVDPLGARLRTDIALEEGLDGVSLWAFGFDDERVWEELGPRISS
ncbi:glycosyl hydrolase family 18 protein [Ilumatobacter sp.]|uniref:glycosyl hydrolase family 18 protein n=1 Tax=Ilumatobacter sp. TaxID=1967498 RepID=UPI003C56EC4B